MEHRQHTVVARLPGLGEQTVGSEWATAIHTFSLRLSNRGLDHLQLLPPQQSTFARMRIEPGHCQSRRFSDQQTELARKKVELRDQLWRAQFSRNVSNR